MKSRTTFSVNILILCVSVNVASFDLYLLGRFGFVMPCIDNAFHKYMADLNLFEHIVFGDDV